ncbi:uncharacterized protein AMSG_11181 [Thecamonas trahens ATCC 50062]|uniref:Macro domain-containing protein n=1 Tax=Thecamonas trahens ATCC 50062 TaxID=461836 RepID=A0A0L0DTQ9_THETB|nr:hypothetical protein AMSG_11181 [Thecamonas trahens ATCC 50062]KNC55719.1 hypothetical protein AMSG_11181 [Thecamonas trahens ATCC 50062]|eukprot:XP_013752927.1 hypothetical protein AMSG_11181 [Thecamonas trahens ATCC 50062]
MACGSVVEVVAGDIAEEEVDVVINAANSLSFTAMDCGVSGVSVPSTQAGVQLAEGGLAVRGVRYVVHAVGPIWTDWPVARATFAKVVPRIRRTVRRALTAAERVVAALDSVRSQSGRAGPAGDGDRPDTVEEDVGVEVRDDGLAPGGESVMMASVAVPAISGGIFTHYSATSKIKAAEQMAARTAVVEAVMRWLARRRENGTSRHVWNIRLVDICPRGVAMFAKAFDVALAAEGEADIGESGTVRAEE